MPTQPATYTNPVLFEDWPDPDVIRVGAEYALVASSFHRSPGLPLLRSRDLVHWERAGHAVDASAPDAFGALPRLGSGVWAPAIRHHDGRFWVVFPDPDRGIFVTTATNLEGPWSKPHLMLEGLGLIDPCPLWGQDGRTWLVHGWARSRIGHKNRLTVVPVDAELTAPLGPGRTVIDADELGWVTLEGPKFYEHEGWYWIFAPAGGVTDGFQAVFRSRDPYGPYEGRSVLAQGDSPVNGPHQGGWVRTPTGEDWFVHFSDQGPFGRTVHLQPMTWRDGWPVMGDPVAGETWGQAIVEHTMPDAAPAAPQRHTLLEGDDFAGGLGAQWHWLADSRWGEAGEGRFVLRGAPDAGNLLALPSVVGQMLPGTGATLTTSLTLTGEEGGRAGVGVHGRDYLWFGVRIASAGQELVLGTRVEDADRECLNVLATVEPGTNVSLEVHVAPDASVSARYAVGSREDWREVPVEFIATKGRWVGAELVLLAGSPFGPIPTEAIFGPVVVAVGE